MKSSHIRFIFVTRDMRDMLPRGKLIKKQKGKLIKSEKGSLEDFR